MDTNTLPPLESVSDLERVLEFEFVRATENAALQSVHWLGRGEKETADAHACAAIAGIFDLLDVQAEVIIGEGIKDNAPGLFVGEKLGTWKPGSPRFDIALDPIDGTTNVAKGMPNSISVMAAAQVPEGAPSVMRHLPSFYSQKIAFGPVVKKALANVEDILFEIPIPELLKRVAKALDKRVEDLVVVTMDRPRHAQLVKEFRAAGCSLRLISDGDVTATVAPSLLGSGVDLYYGIGGTPEGILTAAALKCLGGGMQMRMWFHDLSHLGDLAEEMAEEDITRVYDQDDLVMGDSALFCATGISDSPLLPGVKLIGRQAETHSILMRARSGTTRHIHAVHDLDRKIIPLRESFLDHNRPASK